MTSEVFNEDCVEGMKRYPNGYFDLAVVDPPYGIDRNSMNIIKLTFKAKLYPKAYNEIRSINIDLHTSKPQPVKPNFGVK